LILGLGLSRAEVLTLPCPRSADLCGGHQLRTEWAVWTTEGVCALVVGHSPGEGWGGPPNLPQTCCAERRWRQLVQDPARWEGYSQTEHLPRRSMLSPS